MKIIKVIGLGVWLEYDKIIGWKMMREKISSKSQFSFNTNNYTRNCLKTYCFKYFNFFYLGFMEKYLFGIIERLAKLWFRRWKHCENYQGFKAY